MHRPWWILIVAIPVIAVGVAVMIGEALFGES